MSTAISRGTIVAAACVGTTLTGLAAYAVYFDYKRRNDADFRRSLKRESRRQARAAKVEAEGAIQQERTQLRAMVDDAVEEGWPTSPEEKEAYFMEEVGLGEKLCQTTGMQKEAALCFFKALRVYPQPKELMTIYDKTVPKHVLDTLAEMEAYWRHAHRDNTSQSSSIVGVE